MSKRQRSVLDLWEAKRKAVESGEDDGDTDSRDGESDFSGSNNPIPSKHNHNFQFDLNMERDECANGTDLFFDFVFHLSGTSSNQTSIECGDRELASKIFEIRWSQFTFTLLRSVLVSWKAMILYFKRNVKDGQCAGYLNYLTKLGNLKLIAFLADVLFVFKRFRKKYSQID